MTHKESIRFIHLLCEKDMRTFKSIKQRDLFLRLHKKKCSKCRECNFINIESITQTKTLDVAKELKDSLIMDWINLQKLGYCCKKE